MLKKIEKLIDVKSIVTILLTIVVSYLAIKGLFEIKEIYLMIIAFYFGTQTNKPSTTTNITTENSNNVTKNEENLK